MKSNCIMSIVSVIDLSDGSRFSCIFQAIKLAIKQQHAN